MPQPPTSSNILEIGLSFRKSKALLSAVELGLFTTLADAPLDAESLAARLGLQGRGARDFFDALVALGFLDRDSSGRYANTPDCALYLDRQKPSYIGGLFEYINACQYENWGQLTQALRTGAPQSGPLKTGSFAALHADGIAFDIFLKGMTGGSFMRRGRSRQASRGRPPGRSSTSAQAGVCRSRSPAQPHLTGGGLICLRSSRHSRLRKRRGLQKRLTFYPGDFFKDQLPQADVLIMGRILHDWDLPTRKLLLKKAHQALPQGGALIVYDSFIYDARRVHANGLLSSLNMLIHTVGGSEYSGMECIDWMMEAGFRHARIERLTTVQWAVVATKH